MLDLFLHRLDVTVKQRGVRRNTGGVDCPGNIEPPLIVQLGPKQLFVDPIAEDLGTAPGAGLEPSRSEFGQDVC